MLTSMTGSKLQAGTKDGMGSFSSKTSHVDWQASFGDSITPVGRPTGQNLSGQGVLAACEGHACDGHLVEGRPRHGVTRPQGIQHHASSKKLDG